MLGPHPSTDPAVHGKPALGYGRRGERSHRALENPSGGEQRKLQPLLSALPEAEQGRTGVVLQDPPQQVLYLPLAPSWQGPTPQKHQTNCNSRESSRNSGSTASQTAAELSQAAAASSCQLLLCQRSATATLIQKGPALAQWSCRDAAGAAQPQSGFPAGTGRTHQSSQGSPQWPLAKSSTTRNSQGALGPSFLPAKPMHRAGNTLKQL